MGTLVVIVPKCVPVRHDAALEEPLYEVDLLFGFLAERRIEVGSPEDHPKALDQIDPVGPLYVENVGVDANGPRGLSVATPPSSLVPSYAKRLRVHVTR